MNMIVRMKYDGVPSNDQANVVGVFVGAELRGVALATNIGGEMYYFITVYSNLFSGDTLRLRAYYAPDDRVYLPDETVVFIHNQIAGEFLAPFWINIDSEQPDQSPQITSPAAVSFQENACYLLYDAQATDPNDAEGAGLTYSIAGGADAAKFDIDAATGRLNWLNFNPDFENPADANSDNGYEVTIRVTNSLNLTDELELTIFVTDFAQEPFLPKINGGAASVCLTGSAVLTASGGGTYGWSNDSTGASITIAGAGVYSVTVTSTGACTATASITALAAPGIVAASNSPVCIGANIQLGCTPSGGSGVYVQFEWTGPDDYTAGIQHPPLFPVTPAAMGVYTVTVTDNAGCTATGATTVTADNAAPSLSCPDDLSVDPDTPNPCSAAVGGIDAVFDDNCSGAILYYNRSGATIDNGVGHVSGFTFAAGVTQVAYTVTDAAGLSAGCFFTVTVGACNTNLEFSGAILWEHNGTSGVQNATVNLTGSGSGNDLTDINGNYLISLPPGSSGNFTLKPVKNINKLNGLSSADATAVQQHVTLINLLPGPFKRIAADVNKSNSITTTDASLINQVLLGNPQANAIFNTSWRFVPAAYSFPNPNIPWGFPEQIVLTGVNGNITGQDFKGIKLGDVVATWANPANVGAPEYPGLVFRVQDQVLEAGSEVAAEFRADQLDDLNSFQFALYFDPEQLQLVEIEPLTGLPVSMDNFGLFNLAEGEIRVVWAQAAAVWLSEAAPVFRLRFRALQSGARLSEVLRLNDEVLPGYCYNSAYTESGVELRYSASTGTGQSAPGAGLSLSNRPNPFSDVTTLYFVLPEAGEVELRISDAAGRLLFSQKHYYGAGRQEKTLLLEGASGVLFAELVTAQGTVLRRILAEK